VVAEHLAKALAGDPLHSRLESDMKAMATKNVRKRSRQALFVDDMVVSVRKSKDYSALVVLWVFDANTVVESILLASAILVNIIGVMLDSTRFAGDKFYLNQGEYAGLAIGCIFIITSTIIYYVCCIALELTVVFCPHRITSFFNVTKCLCKRFTERKLRGAQVKATSSNGRASRVSFTGGKGGPALGMVINPAFLKGDGTGKGIKENERGLLGGESVEGMAEPPTSLEVWNSIKASYARMAKMITSLQEENKNFKKAAASNEINNAVANTNGKSSSAGGRKSGTPVSPYAGGVTRTRTLFNPTLSHGGDGTGNSESKEGTAEGGGDFSSTSNPLRRTSTKTTFTTNGGGRSSSAGSLGALHKAMGSMRNPALTSNSPTNRLSFAKAQQAKPKIFMDDEDEKDDMKEEEATAAEQAETADSSDTAEATAAKEDEEGDGKKYPGYYDEKGEYHWY
jgi:hypothetical protein